MKYTGKKNGEKLFISLSVRGIVEASKQSVIDTVRKALINDGEYVATSEPSFKIVGKEVKIIFDIEKGKVN